MGTVGVFVGLACMVTTLIASAPSKAWLNWYALPFTLIAFCLGAAVMAGGPDETEKAKGKVAIALGVLTIVICVIQAVLRNSTVIPSSGGPPVSLLPALFWM